MSLPLLATPVRPARSRDGEREWPGEVQHEIALTNYSGQFPGRTGHRLRPGLKLQVPHASRATGPARLSPGSGLEPEPADDHYPWAS